MPVVVNPQVEALAAAEQSVIRAAQITAHASGGLYSLSLSESLRSLRSAVEMYARALHGARVQGTAPAPGAQIATAAKRIRRCTPRQKS